MPANSPDHPDELRRGLPMVETRDREALEREKQILAGIDARPHFWQRWKGYWGLSGPGWVQSALTLGAGSASAAIFAGAVYGYKLLWVQPVAMFLGVMMFAAIGHQLLTTRARLYDVFWKKLNPSLALLWGFNVFLASVIWQFPQYSLGTAVFQDIFAVFDVNMPKGIIGAFYKLPLWLPVIVSSFNLVMMPVAYIGFFLLQNKKSYLGEDVSRGVKGTLWNIVLIVAILVVAAGAAIKILSVLGFWQS